jgi:hypothetical protein
MKRFLVRAYFKAGILVPFYTACFFSLLFCWTPDFYKALELTFFSGLTGLCSLTIFLNCYPNIVNNYFYSFLSWTLLPVLFSIYVLTTKVDWVVFSDSKKGDVFISSLYLVIFFIHFLGLVISFQSFRATVLLNRNDEEVMNDNNNPYTTHEKKRNANKN